MNPVDKKNESRQKKLIPSKKKESRQKKWIPQKKKKNTVMKKNIWSGGQLFQGISFLGITGAPFMAPLKPLNTNTQISF